MIVKDLINRTEMLTDCNDISIERTLGGEHTIQFTAYRTENNAHAYDLVQGDSLIEGANETFVIKDIIDTPYSKNVIAINAFFETIDDYVEEQYPDGLYTIQESLQHAFSTSEWTYLIDGNYPQRARLESFGNDNPVSMLNKILSAFNSEYEIDTPNKRVIIKRRLGVDTDYQIRDKHNITAISRTVDAKNVKTAVKVFYDLDEFGNYNSSVIYYSPNRNKYRKTKWREPIYGDNVTSEASAISTARLILKDTPDITFSVEFTTLQGMGYGDDDVQLGNGVFLIDERLGIESTARIVGIREFYKQVNGQLVKDINRSPIATISNVQRTVSRALVQQQQQQAQIERVAVKQKNIYNGCMISKEEGFTTTASNGVKTYQNSSEGFKITVDDVNQFFVDPIARELTLDGRLMVTSGQTVYMDVFRDNAGGLLNLYDKDGLLNVQMGSNINDDIRTGGSFTLYNDGNQRSDARVEFEIYRNNDSGAGTFRSSDGSERVVIEAANRSNNEPRINLIASNVDGGCVINPREILVYSLNEQTTITENEIVINNFPVRENFDILFSDVDRLFEEINRLDRRIDNL